MKIGIRGVFILILMFFRIINISAQSNGVNHPATDHLGRKLPVYEEVGDIKPDKVVAMFYYTWHEAFSKTEKAQDLSLILPTLPSEALEDYNHWSWAPYANQYTFHYDEPIYNYYGSADEWVLRKHVEMLGDAGVDVLICDATNQDITWQDGYDPLLKVLDEAKADGADVPQFAFMMNLHSEHENTVSELVQVYDDLYQPGRYSDLMFQWEGKPLVMALKQSLDEVEVGAANEAAIKFSATDAFTGIGVVCPSYSNNIGDFTFTIYSWNNDYNTSMAQTPIATHDFIDFADNTQLNLEFTEQVAGDYILVINNPREDVGIWKYNEETSGVTSYFNKEVVTGNYASKIKYSSNTGYTDLAVGSSAAWTPVKIEATVSYDQSKLDEIKEFFTFRSTMPAYNVGQNAPDQWAWLEIFPQHGFVDKGDGTYEFMPVGVAQNWSEATGDLAAMNEGDKVRGRSFTVADGFSKLTDDSYLYGYNFQEQWDRALEVSPDIVFVAAWNEWTMGRHKDWQGTPVAFPDAFDLEYSRDIEPMRDGYKDAYYYQLTSNIRKFKGMKAPEAISAKKSIVIGADINDWSDVTPIYNASKGNIQHRDGFGFKDPESASGERLHYINNTGRNDIVSAKVARDDNFVYFYVETDQAITASTDDKWMRLFIDIDHLRITGWEGYDFVLNRVSPVGTKAILEKCHNDQWNWTEVAQVDYVVNTNVLEVKVPKSALGIDTDKDVSFEFKWSDNSITDGDIMDFWVDGDVAPSARFNFDYSTYKDVTVPRSSYKEHIIPTVIEFEDFDNGGNGIAYGDITIGNEGGQYRNDEDVDIYGNDTDGYYVGQVFTNESLSYTVQVSGIGKHRAKIYYASTSDNSSIIFNIDGVNVSGEVSLPATGGIDVWSTLDVDLVMNAGKRDIKVLIKNASGDLSLDKIDISELDVVYPSNGTGLIRSIWNGDIGSRTWYVDSLCAETVPVINNSWVNNESPGCGANNYYWNARWEGQIEALYTGEYTFYLTINDMGRVWVNNQLIIDAWTSSFSGSTVEGTINLVAGEKVNIQVDYANVSKDGMAKLEWASDNQPRQVVPVYQLYPEKGELGIEDNILFNYVVYPNPANDQFYIDSRGAMVESVDVYDINGRIIYSDSDKFTGSKIIDIQAWDNGLYFIQLQIGNSVIKTIKFIKN